MNYVVKVSDANRSLNETGRPLNVSGPLPTSFADDAHLAEGQSTLNELKSLKFRFGVHRPTVCIRVGQYFELLKALLKKKGNPCNATEHLKCVISSNSKRYHSCWVWGEVVVEALRYKSDEPGIDFR